ncbi:DNA alkylation repair protein [Kocuria sp. ZOR0020]|uniref:DNA alkylation repair protein n=1 Tax=Kocuria sp. ZOR0020 TaxID=1339234 RepID=UPI0006468D51|nr:DNA alkylation repair protein [Kocuria sp. ZOR0020]
MPTADQMLGTSTVEALARMITLVTPQQPAEHLNAVPAALDGQPMRARVDLVSHALLKDLGPDRLVATIREAATAHPQDFSGWMIWPVTEAVAHNAVATGSERTFQEALDVLAEFTHRFTAEFALRILLRQDHRRVLAAASEWTQSPDEHVRRLASEGTRPLLPWGLRVPELAAEPSATLPILTALHNDPSEYVRRSVANHLNDLSRHHPDLVVQTAATWLDRPGSYTARTVKHALRTVIKRGHPEALALTGYPPVVVDVQGPLLTPPAVQWGGSLQISATVHNDDDATPAKLLIDYVVHHRKANGTTTPKTFKWTTMELAPGETVELTRRHSFREITTRKYHAGMHSVALQINGVEHPAVDFELLPRN